MGEYQNIRFEVSEAVATITLQRPDRLNAYTTEMGEEVVHAFRQVRDDAAVRAVILAGAGRAFCAGVDLEHLKAHQEGRNASSGPKLGEEDFLRKLPLELVEFPKPVIAAIHGSAIGVGVTMTLPCDIRIVAEGAKLAVPFTRLGLLPGLGSTHLLPQLVGLGRALDLVMTGRSIGAEEAAQIGLASRVVREDKLPGEARATAQAMARSRPEVLVAARDAVRRGFGSSMAEAMLNEQQESARLAQR